MPVLSVARTSNVWLPSTSGPGYACGVEQGVNAAGFVLSNLHSKIEPASVAVNGNEADVSFVGLAGRGVPIAVSGGVVSSVKLLADDQAETLPAVSIAWASQ